MACRRSRRQRHRRHVRLRAQAAAAWTSTAHYIWQLLHFNLGVSIAEEGIPGLAHRRLRVPVDGDPGALRRHLQLPHRRQPGRPRGDQAHDQAGDGLTLLGAIINGVPVYRDRYPAVLRVHHLWAIFPQGGNVSVLETPGWNAGYIGSIITHAILPVACYTLAGVGAWQLTTKSSVISVLGDDFILAAELRGLRPLTVARYVDQERDAAAVHHPGHLARPDVRRRGLHRGRVQLPGPRAADDQPASVPRTSRCWTARSC